MRQCNRATDNSGFAGPQRSAGFSLFELVVYIISVAIIYSVAANRFSQFPAAAERASFISVTSQIQAALNLQSMELAINGAGRELSALDGGNPMDYLLETPSNYLGAFDLVDESRLQRRSWYFDNANDELVYLVSADDAVTLDINGTSVAADRVRFAMTIQYSVKDARGNPVTDPGVLESEALSSGRLRYVFRGITLNPVYPYRWDELNLDAQAIASET